MDGATFGASIRHFLLQACLIAPDTHTTAGSLFAAQIVELTATVISNFSNTTRHGACVYLILQNEHVDKIIQSRPIRRTVIV
jgi:hypothetical protein